MAADPNLPVAESVPETNNLTPNPEPLAEPVLSAPQPFYKNTIFLAGAIILVAVLLAGGAYFYFNQKSFQQITNLQKPTPTPDPNVGLAQKLATKSEDFIVAKAGEENIYKKYFDLELSSYPKSSPEDQAARTIIDKMVSDSIALQQSKKEGLITSLDSSVYNSLTLDYQKRVNLVQNIKKSVNNKSDKISGSVISIWFSNLKPGPIGYEAGKAFALEKITKYQQDVKSGKMSIKQVGEAIKNDTSLAKIDPTSYKVNAILNFKNFTKNDQITFDSKFNNLIWGLGTGEVSDIYLAKDRPEGKTEKVDSVYMFAQVESKTLNGTAIDFNGWLQKALKTYEIKYY